MLSQDFQGQTGLFLGSPPYFVGCPEEIETYQPRDLQQHRANFSIAGINVTLTRIHVNRIQKQHHHDVNMSR